VEIFPPQEQGKARELAAEMVGDVSRQRAAKVFLMPADNSP
jgi:hypothetical protein